MLRELSGASHLEDLERRYEALLPLTVKEVAIFR